MHKKAILAGGCFWGMEELFRTLPGVVGTEAGYTGGKNTDPTYEFHPGHAEALEVTYDPAIIDYRHILDFFFQIHNPTTLNQQGNDKGTSYRSAIFYADEEEKKMRSNAPRLAPFLVTGKAGEGDALDVHVALRGAESQTEGGRREHPIPLAESCSSQLFSSSLTLFF